MDGATVFADLTNGTADRGASPSLTDDNTNWARGAFVYDDATHVGSPGVPSSRRVFFVVKNALYEWYYDSAFSPPREYFRDWSTSVIMPVANNRVTLAGNNFGQIVLAEGSMGVLLDGISASVISDPDFVPTDMVVHQDGYFLATEPGTNRFRYSALHNGSSWPVDNYVTAQGRSDTVEALISDRRELWVFGDRSIEVYYNSGDSDIPFQRFQGGYIEMGIIAKFTAQKFDNTVAWLTQNDRGGVQVVRAGDGWTPIIISTPEVSYHMQQYSRVDDAFAYVYQHAGHEFYVLTFPTAGATWVYDALTKQWHRRGHTINNKVSRERYNCHAFYENTHLFGDFENGKIYALDSNIGYVQTEMSDDVDGYLLTGERITNGTFDTDSDWNLGAGWVISGGVCAFTAWGGGGISQQGLDITAGETYVMSIDVANIGQFISTNTGWIDISLGVTPDGPVRIDSNGHHEFTIQAGVFTGLSITAGGPSYYEPFDGDIDNVSIKKYEPTNKTPIPRVRSSQQIAAKNEARTFITQFQIDFDEGVSNGTVWLSYSKDGGHTWSNERPRKLGGDGKPVTKLVSPPGVYTTSKVVTGKYTHRVIWRKLGWGRNWRFRVRTWSTDKIVIKGAWAMFDGEQLEAS